MPKQYIPSSRNKQALANGTETRSLYTKHLSKEDWEAIESIKNEFQMDSYADVVRFAVRKAGGRI